VGGVQTKPIRPRQAGKTIAKAGGLDAATRHTGQACETKPIPRWRPGSKSGATRSRIGADLPPPARAGRLCKTKPIGPGARRDRDLRARNVRNKPNLERRSCETKPIWAGRAGSGGTECAKWAQFPASRDAGTPNCAKQSQLAPGRRRARTCPEPAEGTPNPRGAGAVVRNKAISGSRATTGRSLAPNKANLARVTQGTSAWWKSSYGELNM